jgi:hypothetical protein
MVVLGRWTDGGVGSRRAGQRGGARTIGRGWQWLAVGLAPEVGKL